MSSYLLLFAASTSVVGKMAACAASTANCCGARVESEWTAGTGTWAGGVCSVSPRGARADGGSWICVGDERGTVRADRRELAGEPAQRFSSASPRWSPSRASIRRRAATARRRSGSPRPRRSSCATRPEARAGARAIAQKHSAQFHSKPASTAPTKRQEKLLRTIDALLDARTPRADDLRLALATIEEHRRRPLQDDKPPLYEKYLPVPLSAVRRGGHDRRHELLRGSDAGSSVSLAPSELEEAARELADRLHPGARAPYAPTRAWDDMSMRGSDASFTQGIARGCRRHHGAAAARAVKDLRKRYSSAPTGRPSSALSASGATAR